jgi:hypothetical protein
MSISQYSKLGPVLDRSVTRLGKRFKWLIDVNNKETTRSLAASQDVNQGGA